MVPARKPIAAAAGLLMLAAGPSALQVSAQTSARMVTWRVCNSSRHPVVHIAVVYEDDFGVASEFVFRGWHNVRRSECAVVGQVLEGTNIYYYAETPGRGVRWAGSHMYCVARPGPYEYRWSNQFGLRNCHGNETLEGFYEYRLPVGGGDNRTDFP